VASFLSGQIAFTDIADINKQILTSHAAQPVKDLESVLEADGWARAQAKKIAGISEQTVAA
jgi:1-deoxy-D-xylulose 5-phosphate reductoisomerase